MHHFTSMFTALHGRQTRSSDENSVCRSLCPSIKRVKCDKTEEKCAQIFYTIRKIRFREKEWLVGATPST